VRGTNFYLDYKNMELFNAPLFLMNNLKIKNQKSGGTLALFEKDSYLSVSQ
jgi:hypothetical protein